MEPEPMNREIKFRVWDKKRFDMHYNAEMFDVFQPVLQDENGDIEEYTFAELLVDENFSVMQYTGLKDKNGKEVYEGDILQWPHLKSSSPVVEVYYNDSEFVFVGRPVDRNEETESWLDTKCEVIGNIYETPELLNTMKNENENSAHGYTEGSEVIIRCDGRIGANGFCNKCFQSTETTSSSCGRYIKSTYPVKQEPRVLK